MHNAESMTLSARRNRLEDLFAIRMKTHKIFFIAVPFFCLIILLNFSLVSGEELYKRFSLSTDKLTNAPVDANVSEPGVITAKYGFSIDRDFLPYVGTGLAYSYIPDTKSGDITNIKTGIAAQLGFAYLLGKSLTLKLEYKYLSILPDLPRGDSTAPPQSLGIGLDIRF